MIDRIDVLLSAWAELQRGDSVPGYASIAGAMIDNPPAITRRRGKNSKNPVHAVESRSKRQSEIKITDAQIETGQAVARLPEQLQEVVKVHYWYGDLAVEVRARKLRVSRMTMYRKLDAAHMILDHLLYGTDLPTLPKVIHREFVNGDVTDLPP